MADDYPFKETVRDRSSRARTGVLTTRHGELETPLFLPVGTKASVKAVGGDELGSTGSISLIANAFLLSMKPGVEIIENAGGLHEFMSWEGGIFTDSGGFQMIREGFLEKVTDEGIRFRSPYDGQRVMMTPELCRDIQLGLGSDVAMALDVCPPHDAGEDEVKEAVRLTINWARRFQPGPSTDGQLRFGIVQGGLDRGHRKECLDKILEVPFDGLAIGGLSIGEPKDVMFRVLDDLVPHMPDTHSRYLMGVGSPEDIIRSVERGVDIFDSVFPTRNARHRTLFTPNGKVNVRPSTFRNDPGAVQEDCPCMLCRKYSKSYLSHLFDVQEPLAWRLASLHNITFIQQVIKNMKMAIKEDRFSIWKEEFLRSYLSGGG